jgi:hypothetical protein
LKQQHQYFLSSSQTSWQIERILPLRGGMDHSSKFGPGARARGDARRYRQQPKGSQLGKPKKRTGGGFVDAFSQQPPYTSKPGGMHGSDQGLFNRFSPRATPNFHNPGNAGGPRSITVVGSAKSSDQTHDQNTRLMQAHDGRKAKLPQKSADHLLSKHGHNFGIDDKLPLEPNQKPTKYAQVRTRINKPNRKKFGDNLENILQDPDTKPYPDVSMRGKSSDCYHSRKYGGEHGVLICIPNLGKFKDIIIKALSRQQWELLNQQGIID